MCTLERLKSQYFAILLERNRAVEPMRMPDVMGQDESGIASFAPLSSCDEFFENIAHRLCVRRVGFSYLH